MTSAACPTSSPPEGRGSCSSGMGLAEPFSKIVWCLGSLFQGTKSCRVKGKVTEEGKMIWVCAQKRNTSPALYHSWAVLGDQLTSLFFRGEHCSPERAMRIPKNQGSQDLLPCSWLPAHVLTFGTCFLYQEQRQVSARHCCNHAGILILLRSTETGWEHGSLRTQSVLLILWDLSAHVRGQVSNLSINQHVRAGPGQRMLSIGFRG